MRAYILLVTSIAWIALSIGRLLYAYTPQAGPVGEGPQLNGIWIEVGFSLAGGICFLLLAILTLRRANKKEDNT
ncbi:hypothetical protein LOK74_04785 [Brevibacillus humidisoli]|uniref:hypothetical protein n=1 Tax=Brevibacillus humidisoli TaxID=2895522 RepID=UPI001E550595|nr:hypothetical protein [Brevibacillus humidisoli]UFJ41824.1 hypothetical protein LOK74_04785 [Brevibacillus humidisoli]